MRIANLMEDTPGANGYLFEHGLSFYIETVHHKVLLDTGASEAFLTNAERKGIDLAAVDTVIISHGHYDHAGGVTAFARCNPNAKIYIHQNAVGAFYNLKNQQPKYIGMDAAIADLPQVVFLKGIYKIDDELTVFSGVHGKRLCPRGNLVLHQKCRGIFVPDGFDHEQYLVITEGEHRVLLSGCAHKGILNILDTYCEVMGGEPTHVISGFHTTKDEYTEQDDALIEQTAMELAKTSARYYSGHCTGAYPMQILKGILGERLTVLHSGDEIL